MPPYVVRQGDHLESIAAQFGFDAQEVWQSEDNAELREQRSSPNLLAPGDILEIPEPEPPELPISAKTTNRYQGAPTKVPVKVILEYRGQALANESCTIKGNMPDISATTDGQGKLEFQVPVHVRRVRVEASSQPVRIHLDIGHLNPQNPGTGALERLVNLGYLPPSARHGTEQERAALVQRALGFLKAGHPPGTMASAPTADPTDENLRSVSDDHGS